MPRFTLAFPFRGHRPGDVIDVLVHEVTDLVRSGIGHLEGAQPVLRLGKLPEVAQPVPQPESAPEAPPEPARKRAKAEQSDAPTE